MNIEVSAQKRRGGFYTPPALVDFALARALDGLPGPIVALEPSAGDGAFLRGLRRFRPEARVLAIEREPSEAALCRVADPAAELINDSFFQASEGDNRRFNLLIGNPPYLRYQFVPPEDRAAAERLCAAAGFKLAGVANLWVAFVVVGLGRLTLGGRFALVIPEELFSTSSAGLARRALTTLAGELRVDRVPRSAFPELLQDVIVLSGRRLDGAPPRLVIAESGVEPVVRPLPTDGSPWTSALLPPAALEALTLARALPGVSPLGELARFTVATVTGANAFFGIDDATLRARQLQPWARRLLTHAPDNLCFGEAEFEARRIGGSSCWLLDFSLAPLTDAARDYLAEGEASGLPDRFKCRIRTPWYAVPVVPAGEVVLPKRADVHHRMSLNLAGAHSTDTLYRGVMRKAAARDLVASFHNCLTALGAELEGRSYGGGVLELVPSEVARLPVPLCPIGGELERLDALPVAGLNEATDALIVAKIPAYGELLPALMEGRDRLRALRY